MAFIFSFSFPFPLLSFYFVPSVSLIDKQRVTKELSIPLIFEGEEDIEEGRKVEKV